MTGIVLEGNHRSQTMFIIQTANGMFIHGISHEHQVLQVTAARSLAKRFTSKAKAEAYITKYQNAGYGSFNNPSIIPA